VNRRRTRLSLVTALAPLAALGLAPRQVVVAVVSSLAMAAGALVLLWLIARTVLPPAVDPRDRRRGGGEGR
jgi:hypothetical protein